MAEDGVYGNPRRAAGERKWNDVAIPEIEHEDRMPLEEAARCWAGIFRLFSATGEAAHDEVKLAVYGYYGVNGSSQETLHARDINTGGGRSVLASDVRATIHGHSVRQFLRANVDEAYSALKESGVLEHDEVYVAKAMAKGVPRGFMHCAVDYLRGCSLLTDEERKYSEAAFNYSIRRARDARGGLTVDERAERGRERGLSARAETSRVPASADEF